MKIQIIFHCCLKRHVNFVWDVLKRDNFEVLIDRLFSPFSRLQNFLEYSESFKIHCSFFQFRDCFCNLNDSCILPLSLMAFLTIICCFVVFFTSLLEHYFFLMKVRYIEFFNQGKEEKLMKFFRFSFFLMKFCDQAIFSVGNRILDKAPFAHKYLSSAAADSDRLKQTLPAANLSQNYRRTTSHPRQSISVIESALKHY